MIKPEDCKIVIPHLGGTPEMEFAFDQCLASLKETAPNIEIITAVNGVKCLKHSLLDCGIFIREQGQCKATNAAIATINTKWIFVTNDDMIFSPGWFERLTVHDPEYFVCPNLVEPKLGAPPFLTYFCGGAGGDFDYKKWLDFASNHLEIKTESGFNLPYLIRRDLWNTIGGYDINYDPWGSNGDSDLQTKIELAGVKPVRNRNCIVYHFSQTSGTFHPDNRTYWQKNWDYYIEKWGFERASSPVCWFGGMIDYQRLKYKPEWMGKYA